MSWNITSRVLLVILVLAVALGTASLTLGDAPDASVSLVPSYVEANPGDVFMINVSVNSTVPVYAASYTVLFDPMVLEVVNQTQGSFLTSDGNNSTVLINRYYNTNGTVEYGEFRTGTTTGITGNGTLATIWFRVKDSVPPGSSAIVFKPDETILSDTNPSPINTALYNCTVNVGAAPHSVVVFIRVESNTTTLFNGTITVPPNCTVVDTSGVPHFIDHPTALGALVEAANRSGFTYNISSSAYGLYVTDINGDSWVQYRVNYTSPWDSVDQYSLTGGEYVLFATGQYYPFYPLHILAPPYVPSGKPFQVTVTYYNDTLGEWDLLEEATVLVNDTPVGTTGFGGLTLTLSDGTYALRAEKAGYIRSEKVNVTVGGTHIPPGEQPDLTVFLMLPPHVPPGEQMKVFGVVCNERNGTADTSTLKILANGTSINETTLPVLGPYGVYPFDFNWTPLSEGPLNITAIADYYDVVNESNESNNTATQYVMVGGAPPNGVEVFVRVESNTTTLFADVVFVNDSLITMTDGSLLYLDHPTALGALAEASRLAGFTFNVTNTTSGPYITDINGDSWVQYRVNFTSPNMSADQYTLTGGEYVLFATGQYWPFYPLHIIAPPYVPSGVSFNVTVIYYNDTLGNWTPIAGATVLVDGAPAGTTDAHGNLSLSLADGMHDLRAEKTGYIRSEKVKVNVGVGEKKPPVNITWSTTINATNELEGMMVGMAPDATDGYDPQYDAYTSTPLQGYVLMNLDDLYATNIKGTVAPGENVTWQLTVSVPNGQTTTLSWNKHPHLQIDLQIFDGAMELEPGASLGAGTHNLTVVATVREVSIFTLHLLPGWNMVSLPLAPTNVSVYAVFGNISTLDIRPVITWDPEQYRFVSVTTVKPKQGYWVFSPREMSIEVVGAPINNTTLSLKPGWNMVGTVGLQNMTLSGIPNQVSHRPPVAWDAHGYRFIEVSRLEPGRAVWVFVTDRTEVVI